jgi:hypothetical protein
VALAEQIRGVPTDQDNDRAEKPLRSSVFHECPAPETWPEIGHSTDLEVHQGGIVRSDT